jgi:hypothetical protein
MEETTDMVAAPSEEIVPDEGDEGCEEEEEEEATPDPYLCITLYFCTPLGDVVSARLTW